MTPEEWIAKYGNLGQRIRDSRVIFLATTGTMDVMAIRIWDDGGLSNGGKLTYNEDYELWAYKPPAPRAVIGKGRPSKKTGKSKKIKGGWYPTYLAFKAQQGRSDNPFELTADLRKSWLGGVRPTPTEIDPMMCVIDLSDEQAAKADGLAGQKGEFLLLTTQEKAGHTRRVLDLYLNLS